MHLGWGRVVSVGEKDDVCDVWGERTLLLSVLLGERRFCYLVGERKLLLSGEGIYFECSSSSVVFLHAVISIILTLIVGVL